jgi:glycyl-tRNA synthetase beta chain
MVGVAVQLAKSDLSTDMVNEFSNLQGVMGRYYALNDGEAVEVADAIAEHYSPEGPSDVCPIAPVSIVVAMADKIDTLIGFWAISEKPTGSKDPYALRRATLGVIRLLIENNVSLSLMAAFETSWAAGKYAGNSDEIFTDLLGFFAERLKVHLKEKGVRHDLVSAVFALGDEDNLVRLLSRVSVLTSFITSDDGINMLMAYKRAANILRIEERKDKVRYANLVDVESLSEIEEKKLHVVLIDVRTKIPQDLEREDYVRAMSRLSSLRVPVDDFFRKVTVNCADAKIRVNRLQLLSQIRATMNQVADFSEIEGGEH